MTIGIMILRNRLPAPQRADRDERIAGLLKALASNRVAALGGPYAAIAAANVKHIERLLLELGVNPEHTT
jgi:hypothetical protein